MKYVLVTGGFDPLHSGHIAYLNGAREYGDKLIVGLNSDEWLKRKKGKHFMPWSERAEIISNLSVVDEVIDFNDEDDTANDAIHFCLNNYDLVGRVIFANGGDRTINNIPEYKKYSEHPKVAFQGNVGGNKKNSSSWILREWKENKTKRKWGYYRILHEVGKEVKVKELTVDPGKRLSMQKHKDRAEHWFITEGVATVYGLDVGTDYILQGTYNAHQSLHIREKEWHMLANESKIPLKILEIQYGENCVEDDIERVALRGYD